MKPVFEIKVNGRNVSDRFLNLATCTLTDHRAFQSDTLAISIADPDDEFDLPEFGAVIDFAFGYLGDEIIDKGQFIVDGHGFDIPHDTIHIHARSANLKESVNETKSKSFRETTLGEIVSKVAADQGLIPEINPDIGNIEIAHLDQTNESDGHLITRLGRIYGAVSSIKDGRLVFMPMSRGRSVNGDQLQQVKITRDMISSLTYNRDDQAGEFAEVVARYHDLDEATTKMVSVKVAGSNGAKTKILKQVFPDNIQAKAAADGEARNLSDQGRNITLSLDRGVPDLIAETPIKTVGIKKQIDQLEFVAHTVTHQINTDGLNTNLKLVPLSQN